MELQKLDHLLPLPPSPLIVLEAGTDGSAAGAVVVVDVVASMRGEDSPLSARSLAARSRLWIPTKNNEQSMVLISLKVY